MHASHFCDSKTSLNTWGSWKPNIHCYKPSAVETMTLLQTLGRRIQQHCCKPSAVEPRHCYGFSAMIPFCGTFPKDSKSTALGLLGIAMFVYQRVMGLKSFPHGLGTAPRAEVTDPGFIVGKAFAVVFFGRGQGW